MDRGDGDQRDTGDRVRRVVWDWNGTLFNDHVGVVAAVNDALALLGVASIDADTYRSHYTRPVQRFYEQLAGRPITAEQWQALDDGYHHSYHAWVERMGLAPDAPAALTAAEEAGLTQSLLSMWRHQDLVPLVEQLGIGRFFVRVDGLRAPGGGGAGRVGSPPPTYDSQYIAGGAQRPRGSEDGRVSGNARWSLLRGPRPPVASQ